MLSCRTSGTVGLSPSIATYSLWDQGGDSPTAPASLTAEQRPDRNAAQIEGQNGMAAWAASHDVGRTVVVPNVASLFAGSRIPLHLTEKVLPMKLLVKFLPYRRGRRPISTLLLSEGVELAEQKPGPGEVGAVFSAVLGFWLVH